MATFTPDPGDGIAVLDAVTYAWAREGYGVLDVSGGACDVTVDSGTVGNADTLDVATGTILHNGSTVSVSNQSAQIDSADPNDPRKDTIWLDSGGNVNVANGTPAPAVPNGNTQERTFEPSAPLPSTEPAVVIAEVWVGAGASTIVGSDVRDRRVTADVSANRGRFEKLAGGVTGNSTLSNIAGSGLDIVNNALEVTGTSTFRYDSQDTTYGTDTSDRDRIDVIPIYATGDQYEIIRLRSDVRGSGSKITNLKHVIANGTANSGNALGGSDTIDWRGNEVFDTGDSGLLPYTLTQDNAIWVGVENDTGSDQTVNFGFDYRVL